MHPGASELVRIAQPHMGSSEVPQVRREAFSDHRPLLLGLLPFRRDRIPANCLCQARSLYSGIVVQFGADPEGALSDVRRPQEHTNYG
ncbi:hypothetical protein VTO73DRAFT_5192 [Trametes versicolor]